MPLTCCQLSPPFRDTKTPEVVVPTKIKEGFCALVEMQVVRLSSPDAYARRSQPSAGSLVRNSPELVAASISCPDFPANETIAFTGSVNAATCASAVPEADVVTPS